MLAKRILFPQHVLVQFLALTLAAGMWGCSGEQTDGRNETGEGNDPAQGSLHVDANGCEIIAGARTVDVYGVSVTLKAPESQPVGDLLLLPAWDEAQDAWCSRSRMCAKALKKGYRIVMPAMGKSLYCMVLYAETRQDWRGEPTFGFLQDTLLAVLNQQFCLFDPNGNNFVIGVGSGARGVIRLLQAQPGLFDAAAALSGDYDPSLNPRDNLYRGFFGDYDSFQARWNEEENVCSRASIIRTPLYLAHGQEDNYVPYSQTELLANILRDKNPTLEMAYHLVPEKGHGFTFWNTQMNEIFNFFETSTSAHAEAP